MHQNARNLWYLVVRLLTSVMLAVGLVAGSLPATVAAEPIPIGVTCEEGNSVNNLIAAIGDANDTPGTEIDLNTNNAPNCTYVFEQPSSDGVDSTFGDNALPIVTGSMTIKGNGATILRSATQAFRFFEVKSGASLTLEDVTLTGGKAPNVTPDQAGGGAIRNFGTLNITDGANITGNNADYGGGIHNASGGSVTIDASNVTGNTANHDGGGIYNEGQVTVTNRSSIGSPVSGNSAVGGGGGVINFNTGVLTVSNSTFQNNKGSNGGGIQNGCAPPNSDLCGHVTISSGIIINNSASVLGGGIWNFGNGNVRVSSSTLSGNKVENSDANTVTSGGAIENSDSGIVLIDNSQLTGNTARFGGAIHNSGTLGIQLTNPSSNTGIIAGTTAISANRAIDVLSNVEGDGGGIFNDGTTSIANSTIGGHDAMARNTARGGGGILNNAGGKLAVTGSTLANNMATANGGGIENNCTLDASMCGNVNLVNSTLSSNVANTLGGGIVNFSPAAPNAAVTIQSSTLGDNHTGTNTGGNLNDASTGAMKILDSIVSNPSNDDRNCAGTGINSIISSGFNLFSDATCVNLKATDTPNTNPLLGSLTNNGGPTETQALLKLSPSQISPAINTGTCESTASQENSVTITTDQRGISRPQGAACDKGAYEFIFPTDTTPPTCALTAVIAGPPKQLQITVQDSDGGLQSINVLGTLLDNATVAVAPFTLGTTAPVLVTATKINQAQPAQVALQVTDIAGNVTDCDPVSLDIAHVAGPPQTTTLTGLLQSDHRITIDNGSPGIKNLRITVNDTKFEVAGLKDGETRTLDVASALHAGNTNTITLTPLGKPDTSASVLVSD